MKFFLFIPFSLFLLLVFWDAPSFGVTQWTPTYALNGEHNIAKGSLLTTIPEMTKEWKITFEVKPTDYSVSGYASVLHATIGGRGGNSGKIGERIPAIWFHATEGVYVATALDGKPSYSDHFKPLPPVGEWTKIEVRQSLVSSRYIFSIVIGNKRVLAKENTKPVELSEVKVYSGSPWYSGQNGVIKNLKILSNDCQLTGETNFRCCHLMHAYAQSKEKVLDLYFLSKVSAS